ncbi:MAG: UDP-N-acetylmuramoyl-L-alanyl-D-glutamate--2,6-diaminopimelate ligase [Chloroflexi bacterium]|nr:MAG: UDP-N-acetylmuramoyl-L-alanyl-D-glutamate--2,6-diaminopimelate ligase [Chloroflexota bacterium]
MPPQTMMSLLGDVVSARISGDRATLIQAIAYDSREVIPGGLFVALRGGYVDGRQFLQSALQRGAAGALVAADTDDDAVAGYRVVARVPDPRATLAQVAARFYAFPSQAVQVVGVTGTDGKTTTSHMIEAVLRANGWSTGMVGTVAVRIGEHVDLHETRQTTPESLHVQRYLAAMRAAGVGVAVVEATSHGLALHRVDCCEFDVGVITNITHEHLDFHGSLENYRLAKANLLERVADSATRGRLGVAVLNADDAGTAAVRLKAEGCRVVNFSLEGTPGAEISARDVVPTSGGSTFRLFLGGDVATVRLPLPGRYNVANALAAAGACRALGLGVDEIANGLATLPPVPGRMEVIDLGQPFTVVVDYAHTPEALTTLFQELRPATQGKLLALFGSAGERDIAKRAAQGRIGMELTDYLIITSEDPRFEDPDAILAQIAEGAVLSGGIRGVHFECIEDRAAAILALMQRARPGDTVVLAGKGHEHSMIYGAEMRPWDEAEQARFALRQLGYAGASQAAQPKDRV